MALEPILTPAKDPYSIDEEDDAKYIKAYRLYENQAGLFWINREFEHLLGEDRKNWEKLDENAKRVLKHILAFFAFADGIVNENLAERFVKDVQVGVLKLFYYVQMGVEAVHADAYNMLLRNLVSDKDEKKKIFSAIKEMPVIAKKCRWAQKWIEGTSATFAERLFAFGVVEGVFFSGAFAFIFWFRKQKGDLLPALFKANQFIARDEGLHRDYACLIHREYLKYPLTQSRAEEILKEAVEIEEEFVNESLGVGLVGMNPTLMNQYVQYVSDHLMVFMGLSKVYGVSNPFPWMESICLDVQSNFFEDNVPTNYQKSGGLSHITEKLDDF